MDSWPALMLMLDDSCEKHDVTKQTGLVYCLCDEPSQLASSVLKLGDM